MESELVSIVPRKLYRYEKATEQRADTLCRRQLWASKPAFFNDLFDCQLDFDPFAELSWPLPRIREVFEKLYTDDSTSSAAWPLSPEIVRQLRKCLDTEGDGLRTTIGRALVSATLREEFAQSVAACCFFAAAPTDPLMWAHYGDNHRGFCVEYDVAVDLRDLIDEPIRLMEVEYSSRRPTLSFPELAFSPVQAMHRVLRTKQMNWAYEREYRVVLQGASARDAIRGVAFDIPPWLKPARVIVGARLDNNMHFGEDAERFLVAQRVADVLELDFCVVKKAENELRVARLR